MSDGHVRIFYPADPVGVVPGGIDTFLRGLIKYAPPDLSFSLVGMTTDSVARPPLRWTRCQLGQREFDFFPAVAVDDAGTRGKIPLSVRFMWSTSRYRAVLSRDFDVFDFHRPEPALLFNEDQRPKNAYFHQDPQIVRLNQSDNLWKHLPSVYESIESRAVSAFASAWCVRESGVQTLRTRYPKQAARFRFIPTWVDADVFYPVEPPRRAALRHALATALGIDPAAQWIVTVGRLDTQKNPALMLDAFARIRAQGHDAVWLAVGDGVLRADLERRAAAAGVADRIRFMGLRPPAEIADVLRASDLFALSSAYEGMPMALLEALGCGIPAVVTDVGEVRLVVRPGQNGVISQGQGAPAFAAALDEGLRSASAWHGEPALAATQPYQPQKVLAHAYENYRQLARPVAALRGAAAVMASTMVQRRRVIGIPIDLGDRVTVSRRLIDWALARESRYACFCNVHSAVLASHNEKHRLVLEGADLVAPDGAPVAATLRAKGHKGQERVDGPGMMWRLCDDAQRHGVKVGLYGSMPNTLLALQAELQQAFPKIHVSYAHSPPFRELSQAEDDAVCRDIDVAGVGLLFVGLGCPKQELWMAEHRGRIPAVMLGVGAAFEFHAGTASRAPQWMREHGLEWLHRLGTEPRRLWRRYLFTNSVFLAKSAREAARSVSDRLKSSGR